jgi:hypothetical protein
LFFTNQCRWIFLGGDALGLASVDAIVGRSALGATVFDLFTARTCVALGWSRGVGLTRVVWKSETVGRNVVTALWNARGDEHHHRSG